MDKYLLQILLDVNTIIIPGLGALTVTNAKTREMMFMSYLKYDDGKLSGYISEKEGMSENDAKNLIAKYVREIRAKLDQGHTYDMFKFGRFVKDKDGDVDFESWGTYASIGEDIVTDTPDDAAGTTSEDTAVETAPADAPAAEIHPIVEQAPEIEEEISIPEPEAVTPEEKPEVTAEKPDEDAIAPETTSVPEFLADEDEKELHHDIIEDRTVTPPATPVSLDELLEKGEEPAPAEEAPKPEPIVDQTQDESRVQVENIYIPPGETVVEEAPAATPLPKAEKIKKTEKQPQEAKPKKKRGAGFWILIVLIILLVVGGICTLLFYDQVKTYLPFLESKRVEAEQQKDTVSPEALNENAAALEEAEAERVANENNPETAPAEQPAEEAPEPPVVEAPAPPVASTDGSKPYHVIAGAFASKENADRFAARQNGTVLGQYDNMYLVSSGAYASKNEAQAAIAGKGWVFKVR